MNTDFYSDLWAKLQEPPPQMPAFSPWARQTPTINEQAAKRPITMGYEAQGALNALMMIAPFLRTSKPMLQPVASRYAKSPSNAVKFEDDVGVIPPNLLPPPPQNMLPDAFLDQAELTANSAIGPSIEEIAAARMKSAASMKSPVSWNRRLTESQLKSEIASNPDYITLVHRTKDPEWAAGRFTHGFESAYLPQTTSTMPMILDDAYNAVNQGTGRYGHNALILRFPRREFEMSGGSYDDRLGRFLMDPKRPEAGHVVKPKYVYGIANLKTGEFSDNPLFGK